MSIEWSVKVDGRHPTVGEIQEGVAKLAERLGLVIGEIRTFRQHLAQGTPMGPPLSECRVRPWGCSRPANDVSGRLKTGPRSCSADAASPSEVRCRGVGEKVLDRRMGCVR